MPAEFLSSDLQIALMLLLSQNCNLYIYFCGFVVIDCQTTEKFILGTEHLLFRHNQCFTLVATRHNSEGLKETAG